MYVVVVIRLHRSNSVALSVSLVRVIVRVGGGGNQPCVLTCKSVSLIYIADMLGLAFIKDSELTLKRGFAGGDCECGRRL